MDALLEELGDVDLPRPALVALIRRELSALRRSRNIPDGSSIAEQVRSVAERLAGSRIQPVINATGVVVHTNLGRSPIDAAGLRAVQEIGARYNNLEYDLVSGGRGVRASYVEHNLAVLCGAQSATIVNNNAAALVLVLSHFCDEERSEVVISRGELIQIGGGFRIPDILESSGAKLREIGTTNKTVLDDYARAVTRQTALILKVHRSNFFMQGFVEQPEIGALATLAKKKRVPCVEDLGSGAVVDTAREFGLEHEPTPAEQIKAGVDLVCFSGDKLLGGPQAGIIAGKKRTIDSLKKHPFFRALRCDKLILAALQETVDVYLRGRDSAAELPLHRMLRMDLEELNRRAGAIIDQLEGLPLTPAIASAQARVGGGALPRQELESVCVDVQATGFPAAELAQRLRRATPPVVGTVVRNRVRLDLRTVFPEQDTGLVSAIRDAVT